MDNLKELGKNLGNTNKSTDAVLRRLHPLTPIVDRVRDIFDWVIPFEMDFYISEHVSTITLDLQFALPPEICCANCVCVACEKYDDIEEGGIITTEYPFVSIYILTTYLFSSSAFVMGEQAILNEGDGWFSRIDNQTIRIDNWASPLNTSIKVCYTYMIEGCT